MPTKTINEKMEENAVIIRKGQDEAKAAAVTDKELKPTREIKDVLRDKVTMLDGHIGLKLKDDTTLAENLQVLSYVLQMGDHVQFMIGDVMNHGDFKFGEKKYRAAIEQTGMSRTSLYRCAETARLIPVQKRIAALPFSHHAELVVLRKEPPKLEQALKDLAKQKNGALAVIDVRDMVKKLAPKKPKPAKKATAPKGKKGATVDVELEELTAKEEQLLADVDAALDEGEEALTSAKSLIFNIKKIDNDFKEDLSDRLEFFVKFYNEVVKKTGSRR